MKSWLLTFLFLFVIVSLCRAQNPTLWGMTNEGGEYNNGTIFQLDTSGTLLSTVHNFIGGATDGAAPRGNLLQASDSLLYGITPSGGDTTNDGAYGIGYGTIFSYNIAKSIYTVLYHFGNNTDGKNPFGSLIQANNGLLYGMTLNGGVYDLGTIFSYNISTGVETDVHDFGKGEDGQGPISSLFQATNGLLYGMTNGGGIYQWGMIFSYNISTGIETDVHDFNETNNDGALPFGSFIQINDTLLYGMVFNSGTNSGGIIMSYNIYSGKETVIYNFWNYYNDGRCSFGSLIQAKNGLLYGMTSSGGNYDGYDAGTIFSYDIYKDTEIVIHSFGNGTDGRGPVGSLLQASNGRLYGMTFGGGKNDSGMVFSYNISTGIEADLHDFSGDDGRFPYGDLIEVVNVTTGINQLSSINSPLSIYPNPTTGQFTIKLNGNQNGYTAEVYNVVGEKIYVTLNPLRGTYKNRPLI